MLLKTASLVRRFEATATTSLPVVLWGFLGPPLVGSVLRIESVLAHVGLISLPGWFLLTAVWSFAAVWVVLDGATGRFVQKYEATESEGDRLRHQRRATYGMRIRGLEFRSVGGDYVTFAWCACRISVGILTLPLAPVSLLLALGHRDRRTIADRLCGTVVCKSADLDDGYCGKCGCSLTGLL